MLKVGDRVKCSYRAEHIGTIIATNDTRIWSNTLAFPQRTPLQAEVDEHIALCESKGLNFENETPVAWDFGKFYWDSTDSLEVVDE